MKRLLSQLWLGFATILRRTLGRCIAFLIRDELDRRFKRFQKNERETLRRFQPRNAHLNALQKLLKLHSINKERVASEMALWKGDSGVSGLDEPGGIIVSLTSYPARMYDVHFTIHSLLSQTKKPEQVILWLGEDRFPEGEASVPAPVLALKKRGLTIRFCKDLRAFTKLIPSLAAFPGKSIVTADDDIYYPPDWLEKLSLAHRSNPELIWGNRLRAIAGLPDGTLAPYRKWKAATAEMAPSYANFITGVGGVLYPPGCLHPDVFDEAAMFEASPNNDDIWFWAMAVRQGTKIGVVPDGFPGYLTYVNPMRELGFSDDGTLASENVAQGANESQLEAVFARYPEVLDRLKQVLASNAPIADDNTEAGGDNQ